MSFKHVITILALLVILGFVAFLPNLLKHPSHLSDEKITYVECNLNLGVCKHRSPIYGDLVLSVLPKEFPALKPLKVTLITHNANIRRAYISLDGKDMFMGVNQAMMNKSTVAGQWEGIITIPVCAVDASMTWLFSLTLQGAETERLVFNIKSEH